MNYIPVLTVVNRDTYSISRCSGLFLSKDAQDADFPTVDMLSIDPSLLEIQDPITGETRLEQEKAIPSVCDFVTEYINSDVLVGHPSHGLQIAKLR